MQKVFNLAEGIGGPDSIENIKAVLRQFPWDFYSQ
jgi:hypothetical protein